MICVSIMTHCELILKSSFVSPHRLVPSELLASHTCRCGGHEIDDAVSDQDPEDDGAERLKIMKQLAFPEVEGDKFNPQNIPKVSLCIQKRVAKLNALIEKFKEIQTKNPVQSAFSPQFFFQHFLKINTTDNNHSLLMTLAVNLRPHRLVEKSIGWGCSNELRPSQMILWRWKMAPCKSTQRALRLDSQKSALLSD